MVCGCRHLDADEAVALGAAMVAANMSTTFRLGKKFGMADGASYPIVFQVIQCTMRSGGTSQSVASCGPKFSGAACLLSWV